VPAAPDTNPASVFTGSEIAADAIDAPAKTPRKVAAQNICFMSDPLFVL
jgi:hypothetical protein